MKEAEGILKSKHLRRYAEQTSHPDNKAQQSFSWMRGTEKQF
jgi:hypothetical protein